MTPSRDRLGGSVLQHAFGFTDAAQRLRAEALPASRWHAQGKALHGVDRRRHGAGLSLKQRSEQQPGRAVTHHQQTRGCAAGLRQVIVVEAQYSSTGTGDASHHIHCGLAAGRSPNRAIWFMIVSCVHRVNEQALPVPLDPGSAIVPVLDDGAHSRANSFAASRIQVDLLVRLGGLHLDERSSSRHSASTRAGRLDDPMWQIGKIDGL